MWPSELAMLSSSAFCLLPEIPKQESCHGGSISLERAPVLFPYYVLTSISIESLPVNGWEIANIQLWVSPQSPGDKRSDLVALACRPTTTENHPKNYVDEVMHFSAGVAFDNEPVSSLCSETQWVFVQSIMLRAESRYAETVVDERRWNSTKDYETQTPRKDFKGFVIFVTQRGNVIWAKGQTKAW